MTFDDETNSTWLHSIGCRTKGVSMLTFIYIYIRVISYRVIVYTLSMLIVQEHRTVPHIGNAVFHWISHS